MSNPRPILKRGDSYRSSQSYTHIVPPSPPHGVHFPPSPTLTRTFSAYSPSAYDRSPIVVSPNSCALPERGCPGRTYTLDDSTQTMWSHNGRHLHPRAVNSHTPSEHEVEEDPPTGSYPILPPLIPDLSSESEESDGFISPPLSSSDRIPYPLGYNTCSNQSQHALSFLPHPASPGDESQKTRRRKQRDQSKLRRAVDSSYKSSLSALSRCSLDEGGCLGGF